MMPVGTLEGFKADSFHRTLDTETFRGAIQGIPFDLNQLAKELQKLDRNADLWLRSNRSRRREGVVARSIEGGDTWGYS
jgi:hypothetical protein